MTHDSVHLDGHRLDTLWDFSAPDITEQRLREERARYVPTSPVAAELDTQIARSLGLQGHYDEALAVLDGVAHDNLTVQARVALERGRVLHSAGKREDALEPFQHAVLLATRSNDTYLHVDALHMLAIVDPARTPQWTQMGLTLADASNDSRVRRWRGPLLNNLGWTYFDAGMTTEALEVFKASLAVFIEDGVPENIHSARWAVARCLRETGQTREALAMQEYLQAADPYDQHVEDEIAILTSKASDTTLGENVEGQYDETANGGE